MNSLEDMTYSMPGMDDLIDLPPSNEYVDPTKKPNLIVWSVFFSLAVVICGVFLCVVIYRRGIKDHTAKLLTAIITVDIVIAIIIRPMTIHRLSMDGWNLGLHGCRFVALATYFSEAFKGMSVLGIAFMPMVDGELLFKTPTNPVITSCAWAIAGIISAVVGLVFGSISAAGARMIEFLPGGFSCIYNINAMARGVTLAYAIVCCFLPGILAMAINISALVGSRRQGDRRGSASYKRRLTTLIMSVTYTCLRVPFVCYEVITWADPTLTYERLLMALMLLSTAEIWVTPLILLIAPTNVNEDLRKIKCGFRRNTELGTPEETGLQQVATKQEIL